MAGNTPDVSPPSLKILMTADAVGGVWQYAVDLIAGITAENTEVLLATLGPPPSEAQRKQIASLPQVKLVCGNYPLEWMQNSWSDVDASGEWLLKLESEFQPDLIHLNGYSLAALPWRKPALVVAHSCVYSWWRAVYNSAPGVEWSEYKTRVTAGLAASSIVVTPSAAMGKSIQIEYTVPPDKTRIIHNFSCVPESVGEQKDALFLAAGRLWDPAKNLRLLDEIAPTLDWPVQVAGSETGPEQSAISVKAIQPLGNLSRHELTKRLHAAAVFVHPALYEPFGLAVLEAARSKCCLALSNIPSLRELWDGAALFLDPHDPEEWTFELNALCRDFSRRAEFSKRAFKRAGRYLATTATAAYLQTYRSLVSRVSSDGVAA